MTVELNISDEFKRNFKRLSKKYNSLGKDYLEFRDSLLANPNQGVSLGNGLRKVRMAITSKGKGKSGGARVITLNVIIDNTDKVTLLTIYDKNEMDNISDDYINSLAKAYR